MLDVHPPHQAAHTWKDFFIHIATITVGLLIAIGLEQTVEAIHHNHQRHQLEANLHAECVRNDEILSYDLKFMATKRAEAVALRDQVEAVRRGGAKTQLPDLPPDSEGDSFKTAEGVWAAARDSSQLALLPSNLAELYEELYAQPGFLRVFMFDLFNAGGNVDNFETQFPARTPSGHLVLAQLTPDQLTQYSALLTRYITENDRLASADRFYLQEIKIVLDGATSEEELHRRMIAAPVN